jgi:antirestriction protein ArdC
VAGFRSWLALGYCVRKGEKSLRIWAPLSPSKKAVEEWKRAGSDPGKAPKTRFRLVPVFDRSQVEPLPDSPNGPAPLDPPHEPIAGDALAPLLDQLSDFGASIGSEVAFEPITGRAHGFLEPTSGKIVIDTDPAQSANARVATLVHEQDDDLVRADRRDEDPQLDYNREEVVVECVSFCVCASLGLDTAGYSAPYVAGWGGEDALDQVEAYARLIDRLAGRIEDAVLSGNESSISTELKSITGGGKK